MDSNVAQEAQDFAEAIAAELDHLEALHGQSFSSLDDDIKRVAQIILHALRLQPRIAALGFNPSVYLAYRAGMRAERQRLERELTGSPAQPSGLFNEPAGPFAWAATLWRKLARHG